MLFIGIDPGRGGGIAAVDDAGRVKTAAMMPATERDVLDLLKALVAAGVERAVLEHVWSIPGQGGAFEFGRGIGHLQMALTALDIPFDKVVPKTWQKGLLIAYPPESTDTQKKKITRQRAQQLFPVLPSGLRITNTNADALLLAEYCRRGSRNSVYTVPAIRPVLHEEITE